MYLSYIAGVDITMRTCPKCGRNNNPTRKFCTRCGASLLAGAAEEAPKEKTAVPEKEPVTPIETPPSPKAQPEPAIAAHKSVRPSQVQKDRVIPAERHVDKTELEKAQEAFARAEDVGIAEGDSGIVETRMLRASEVRELMDNMSELAESSQHQTPDMMQPPGSTEPVSPPIPSTQDLEEGILGSKSALIDRPEPPPPAAPPPEPPIETAVQQGFAPIAPAGAPPRAAGAPPGAAGAPPGAAAPKPTPEPTPPPVTPEPVMAAAVSPPVDGPVPEVEAIVAKIHDPEYFSDSSVSKGLVDLRHLHIERKQVEVELEGVRTRQETEVLNYRNAVEVKRIRQESLHEEARHAKEEWNDAEKELRRAEDRKKKEISSREKRIEKIQKNISKAESDIEKRVRALNKEKEKLAKEEKARQEKAKQKK
ncbi:MAG: zinc-ribbon domain-containing protein [Candidatus Thorarchaeota archaeon]|jgi:ribosomal protein S27AE